VVSLPTPTSKLPATQPGSGLDEGVFLVTTADDGRGAAYFIANSARHSILFDDMQFELHLNALWPVRWVGVDHVLEFPEGAPVGSAPTGLLGEPSASDEPDARTDEPDTRADEPEPPAAELPAPEAETPAELPTVDTYAVKRGDTAYLIASRFGVDLSTLLAANAISNPNRVYVGQALMIPEPGATPELVESPSEPTPVAAQDEEPVADGPDEQTLASDFVETPDDSTLTTYTVKPGDSAFLIARQFGIDLSALLATNAIATPSRLYVGQVLSIPTT
jgi:LysM repeat protein